MDFNETAVNSRASPFQPGATDAERYQSNDVELLDFTSIALDYLEVTDQYTNPTKNSTYEHIAVIKITLAMKIKIVHMTPLFLREHIAIIKHIFRQKSTVFSSIISISRFFLLFLTMFLLLI